MTRSISAVLISLALALTGCGDPYFTAMDAKPAASETPPEETPPPNNGTGGSSAGTSATGGSSGTPSNGGVGNDTANGGSGNGPSAAGTGNTPNVPSCVPEEVQVCACDPSRQQVCSDDGTRWSSCGCNMGGNPSTNTGGSSGMEGASGSSGNGGVPSSGGASGSSGTAGAGAPSSSGGSSGTAGTGGMSAGMGGTGGSVTTVTYRISFILNEASPSFKFTHLSLGTDFYFPNQGCIDIGGVRECDIIVDPALAWEIVASTGWQGAGSWLPGKDSGTGKCTAYKKVLVGRLENDSIIGVPFSMVSDGGSGCHFRIEAQGALPNAGSNDRDNDSVLTADDCDDVNPSILSECSAGGGNVHMVRFLVIGSGTGGFSLEPQPGVNNANVMCQSESVYDPNTTGTSGTFPVCYAKVDRDQDVEFAIGTNGTWATGIPYAGSMDCVLNQRVYVDDEDNGSLYPAARYDEGGPASGKGYLEVITPKYISQEKGCHLILHRM